MYTLSQVHNCNTHVTLTPLKTVSQLSRKAECELSGKAPPVFWCNCSSVESPEDFVKLLLKKYWVNTVDPEIYEYIIIYLHGVIKQTHQQMATQHNSFPRATAYSINGQ